MTVTMEDYPYVTNTTMFEIEITARAEATSALLSESGASGADSILGNAPGLDNSVFNDVIRLAWGESWVEELKPYDDDNDLLSVVVNTDVPRSYITFDEKSSVLAVSGDTEDK